MKRLKMGLIGPGFIAAQHIEAVRRLGDVEVVALAGSSREAARRRADEWHVERAYGDYRELIADPDIDVVHNTTPNHLHLEVSLAALAARKHVVSDKPLADTAQHSRTLWQAARRAGVAHVVTFNYRGNPLVQEARAMVARGDLGPLSYVHGQYLQDWLTDARVYSWRLDPARGGASSALRDIGSHWCDLAEHVTGLRIEAVLADLTTVVTQREVPRTAGGTFSRTKTGARRTARAQSRRVRIKSEDLATVLLRFRGGARGCVAIGQVLPGHKNDLQLEVCGRKASVRWLQERQNELWVGRFGQPSLLVGKDPAILSAAAAPYAHLPAGHQEGWADAFRNVIADAYEWIRAGARPQARPAALATFADGYRSDLLVEAMLGSHAAGGVWRKVPQAA
ncbi:MAG TPA: Gfo/Idh/MocA family oxidoreductase [Steroidobacteraceae bacterium]|nr:Gfo/Idh/MocA family oxidoreductase [Steroidobacteraceae bacterium]